MKLIFFSDSKLKADVRFDREDKKSYMIPIAITDSGEPPMTGTSTLQVVIGDENDNPMKEGFSSIFVYNYKVCFFTVFMILFYFKYTYYSDTQ